MKNAEIPLDFSFIFELAQTPSLEEELHLEKEIRSIQSSDDIERVKRYAEDVARQNHQQSIFISHCLDKIHYLYAKIACMENRVVQPKQPWWGELFNWDR